MKFMERASRLQRGKQGVGRRAAVLCCAVLCGGSFFHGQQTINKPSVSEQASPPQEIQAEARDGNKAVAVVRKPPGEGRFPAVIFLHGGLSPFPVATLKEYAASPTPSRFLAAGYVTVIPTFRSRREDPQTEAALWDTVAITEYVKRLPDVDPNSVVVYGCSGGGSLALELAGQTRLPAIASEEPATVLFTGMFTKDLPRKGPELAGSDSLVLTDNHQRYFTPELRKFTRDKIRRITCPILILHGDDTGSVNRFASLNRFNNDVFVPELRAARKKVEVIAYPEESHCFGIWGDRRPAAGKLFADVASFFKRYLRTQPVPIDQSLVSETPIPSR